MKKEWITDTSKMFLTPTQKEMIDKVLDYTDTILYYCEGHGYKAEDPSDTIYYRTQDELVDAFAYTYTELEKEGVFEEDAPADPWLKVLEDRVDEWQKRLENQDILLKKATKHFKEWVNRFVEESSPYDIEIQLGTLKDMESAYKFAWERLGRAKDDLEAYKRVRGCK